MTIATFNELCDLGDLWEDTRSQQKLVHSMKRNLTRYILPPAQQRTPDHLSAPFKVLVLAFGSVFASLLISIPTNNLHGYRHWPRPPFWTNALCWCGIWTLEQGGVDSVIKAFKLTVAHGTSAERHTLEFPDLLTFLEELLQRLPCFIASCRNPGVFYLRT